MTPNPILNGYILEAVDAGVSSSVAGETEVAHAETECGSRGYCVVSGLFFTQKLLANGKSAEYISG